ncbi:methylthioadenosine nucleosidase /adenosylhomocysteine nucleosidase [Arboricoccus pini]|uniref:adenosylhomocysteine nucleosidase n=1 Tax=Arboricoccus pini TaxID=1963835 RepID=A0A212Q4P5_9PROT|nr:5'-methylthioadenosine/adenosylhomocysteine nucleosidase [Arboricoccus pini]SNB54196.1 methylthioadenosine nucleosidase /adenosylhomocysteine nucleosidase [Arboricoccus pini]
MTIAVLCAIPHELEHLASRLDQISRLEIGTLHFLTGRLDATPVVLVGAGIGKVNTAMATTLLVDRFQAKLVIFSGVAGGLDPALAIGDIVIADRTIQHDAGWIENDRLRTYQAGHVPFFNPTERLGYPADPHLLELVRRELKGFTLPALPPAAGGLGRPARIVTAPILSGDQYIHCETTRRRLHVELSGAAVEMEGGALAQVCEAMGVDWLDIRALSDLAGTSSRHDFNAFVDAVAASSALILRRLLPALERLLN